VLPHWGHLFRFGACQRFAALRVRNRILDVLRFGTPMAGGYESIFEEEYNVATLKRFRANSRNPLALAEGNFAGFFDSAEFILSERSESNGLRSG
jgi:hypothetical protein